MRKQALNDKLKIYTMKNIIINFDEFTLPFDFKTKDTLDNDETSKSEEVEDDEYETFGLKEQMEKIIPMEALFLGTIDNEVDNYCTSWSIQDEYYITPIKDEKYNWALFRLSWDDNWGTWNWRFDARINFKGSYSNEVGKHILLKLWYKWDLDLNDTDNEPYVCLLNNL